MALSTAVKIARRIDLSTAGKLWRGIPHLSSNPFSTATRHRFGEIGYAVDVPDLLSTPERDFLFKNNGQKVPISSLKGQQLLGLYFCDNIPHPPRMRAIKKVYEEAKSRGYDFEVVQITFHYRCNNAKHLGIDLLVRQCREDISWLTLPLMDPVDPTCKKLQRIFESADDEDGYWLGDSLVLVHQHSGRVVFEFSGAEILKRWGIEGYPFTRPSLYKVEYEAQKREATLQRFFPPGGCLLQLPRSSGDGFDLVDAFTQLSGKRVLVLFGELSGGLYFKNCDFVRMLKAEYLAQLDGNAADESKFEVVYVPTGGPVSFFDWFTEDMPWLIRPLSSGPDWRLLLNVFRTLKTCHAAVAFNEQGELIAKEHLLGEKKVVGDKPRFPFIDQDLEKRIQREVDTLCDAAKFNN